MKKNTLILLAIVSLSTNAQLETVPGKCLITDNTQWQDARKNDFSVPATTEFTISAWVKASGEQKSWAGIVTISSATNSKIGLIAKPMTGETHNRQLGVEFGSNGYAINTGLVIPDNVWTFVGMTISGTTLKVFLNDSVSTHTIAAFSVSADTGSKLWVASNTNSGSRIWNGMIDEVAVYSSAIPEADMTAKRSYIKDQAYLDAATTMLAYYQFNYFMSGGTTYLEDHKNNNDMYVGGSTKPTIVASTAPITYDANALSLENSLKNTVNIYSNNNILYLKGIKNKTELEVYNFLGQNVFKTSFNEDKNINLSAYVKKGIYVALLKSGKNVVSKKLLIK